MNKLQGLYAITDARLIPDAQFAETVELALIGGAKIIQYRDKSDDESKRQQQAQTIVRLCNRYNALSIINDDLALALSVDADGLHLGQDDASLSSARQQLGQNKIIGISCYNQLQLAITADAQGADYIAFGSFFPSPTKPRAQQASLELLQLAKKQIDKPICAIGGITLDNASDLIDAGADMLAVISSIFDKQDVQTASRQLQQLFL